MIAEGKGGGHPNQGLGQDVRSFQEIGSALDGHPWHAPETNSWPWNQLTSARHWVYDATSWCVYAKALGDPMLGRPPLLSITYSWYQI